MLQRALTKAKREGGKKVSINFQVPIELKNQFDVLCKDGGVSQTSMLTALMETAIEEAQGIHYELDAGALLSMNNRINEIEKELSEYRWYEGGSMTLKHGISPDEYIHMEELEGELKRLLTIFNMTQNTKDEYDNYN